MNSHAGRYPYTCPQCGMGTTNPIRFKEHLSKHTGINYFTCERCGQSFRFNTGLKTHSRHCRGAGPVENTESSVSNGVVNVLSSTSNE